MHVTRHRGHGRCLIEDAIARDGEGATMTFAAASATAAFAGGAQSCIAGDVLTIVPRRTDATLANLSGSLAGSH